MNRDRFKDFLLLAGLLAAALLPRLFLLHTRGSYLFNSDQALIGLMGKHILEGKPMVYAYGQGYMGSLESFLVAVIYLVLGIHRFSVQLAPLLFYLSFLVVNFYLLKRVFNREVSCAANLLLAVSPPLLSELSVTALGGYPEILFFGSLTLWGFLHSIESERKGRTLFLTGLAAGIGFWVHNLVMMYLLAVGLFWFLHSKARRSLSWRRAVLLEGFQIPKLIRWVGLAIHIGVFVFILWNLVPFFTGTSELTIGNARWELINPPFLFKNVKKILRILFAEWAVLLLWSHGLKKLWAHAKPVLPLAYGFFLGGSPAFLYSLFGGEGYRQIHASGIVYAKDLWNQIQGVLWVDFVKGVLGVPVETLSSWMGIPTVQAVGMLCLILGLIGTLGFCHRKELGALFRLRPFKYSYQAFPFLLTFVVLLICLLNTLRANRYLTPLFFSSSLLLALALCQLKKKIGLASWLLLLTLLANQAYANVRWFHSLPNFERIDRGREAVIRLLDERGIRGAYANYWISYSLTLQTKEQIIVAPYRSQDRYPFYTEFVDRQERVAYIFPEDASYGSSYVGFQKALDEGKNSYEKIWVEPFWVYLMDRKVRTEKGAV